MTMTPSKTLSKRDEGVPPADIWHATLGERNQTTPEVSTADVRHILAAGSAILLNSRSPSEYAAGHIAGARNVTPPPGASLDDFVAAVEQLVSGDKSRPLVIYCNGPHCTQGRRLSEHLVLGGFRDVRRYQLGIPVWRALGGPVEIDLDGILRIHRIDRTALFFDARSPEHFAAGSIAGAYNVPIDTLGSDGLSQAPLPRDDFNRRIVLFGRDGAEARKLADVFSRTPFQNVSYFPGVFEALAAAVGSERPRGPDENPFPGAW